MNEITITKEKLKDKYVQAMAEVRDIFLEATEDEDDKVTEILQVGMYGALIGAKFMTILFEKGEEE